MSIENNLSHFPDPRKPQKAFPYNLACFWAQDLRSAVDLARLTTNLASYDRLQRFPGYTDKFYPNQNNSLSVQDLSWSEIWLKASLTNPEIAERYKVLLKQISHPKPPDEAEVSNSDASNESRENTTLSSSKILMFPSNSQLEMTVPSTDPQVKSRQDLWRALKIISPKLRKEFYPDLIVPKSKKGRKQSSD